LAISGGFPSLAFGLQRGLWAYVVSAVGTKERDWRPALPWLWWL